MRKYLVGSVLGALLLVLGVGSASASSNTTYYAGTNAQHQKLLFSVDHTSSGPMFDPVFTTMIDTCPLAGGSFPVQFFFFGFQIPVKHGKFSLALNSLQDRFKWSGTVSSKSASGKEFYNFAALDNSGGLQLCASGSVAWKAPALTPATARPAATRGAKVVVTVTKEPNGSVHFSITHS